MSETPEVLAIVIFGFTYVLISRRRLVRRPQASKPIRQTTASEQLLHPLQGLSLFRPPKRSSICCVSNHCGPTMAGPTVFSAWPKWNTNQIRKAGELALWKSRQPIAVSKYDWQTVRSV
jgi:hypothetical protein